MLKQARGHREGVGSSAICGASIIFEDIAEPATVTAYRRGG
jgi:hypothetical protein